MVKYSLRLRQPSKLTRPAINLLWKYPLNYIEGVGTPEQPPFWFSEARLQRYKDFTSCNSNRVYTFNQFRVAVGLVCYTAVISVTTVGSDVGIQGTTGSRYQSIMSLMNDVRCLWKYVTKLFLSHSCICTHDLLGNFTLWASTVWLIFESPILMHPVSIVFIFNKRKNRSPGRSTYIRAYVRMIYWEISPFGLLQYG